LIIAISHGRAQIGRMPFGQKNGPDHKGDRASRENSVK